MKCKKCGAEVPSGMKFCGECGTAIPQIIKCASCGADIEAGMKFCGNCGAPVSQKKKCISCGAEISYNLKFCPECGANQSQTANNGTPAKPSVTPSKPEEPITMVENLELKKAREQFFACDGNLSEILKTAEGLWKAHSTNEDVLSLYLAALAAGGKEMEALKIIEGLGEGILSTYISAIDILLTKEELAEVEKWLRKASVIFPDNNVLKCYEVYYNLKLYKKYNDFSFLENATNANASLKNVNGPLELSHQLRVMSLLQIESGEEPPTYDKDFCKENNLYFRIVSNLKLGGVYVEGVASEAAVAASAGSGLSIGTMLPIDSDGSKDFSFTDNNGSKRIARFYTKKTAVAENGKYTDFVALISCPDSDRFIFAYNPETGQNVAFSIASYDEDWDDEEDEGQYLYYLQKIRNYCFSGKCISASELDVKSAFEDAETDSIEAYVKGAVESCENYDRQDIEIYYFNPYSGGKENSSWWLEICMIDYYENEAKNKAVMAAVLQKIKNRFKNAGYTKGQLEAEYTTVPGGIIVYCDDNIQTCLSYYWDDFFDKEHSYFVTSINGNCDCAYTWKIEKGHVSFEENNVFTDAYGINGFTDSACFVMYKDVRCKEDVFVLPVKKLIETGEGWDAGSSVCKIPNYFYKYYRSEDIEIEFNDYLRAGDSCHNSYLLDKNGNRITTLLEFDHSEPDEDGYVYYPVPASDLVDGDACNSLTPEAVAKWKAKLGL